MSSAGGGSGKRHLLALDGLRGTAALSVVAFHLQMASIDPSLPKDFWLIHAYLAVDFFFCLSGYVIAYSYDERRGRMTPAQFLTTRLIRLHPMVVLGLLLGVLSYTLDPNNGTHRAVPWLQAQDVPTLKLIGCVVAGLLMIPSWSLPNRGGAYFSLNTPSWSLMWEYLANIAFAFALWRMSRRTLAIIVVLSALVLAWAAYVEGSLVYGYAWGQMSFALIRTVFSFCMGVLLFRSRAALSSRFGFISLSVLMIGLFLVPPNRWNWLYELIVVLFVFPLMVAMGAGAAEPTAWVRRACGWLGRISYPVYATHYAFCIALANYHWTHLSSWHTAGWIIAALTVLLATIAYGVVALVDEPVRSYLTKKYRFKRELPDGVEVRYANKAV